MVDLLAIGQNVLQGDAVKTKEMTEQALKEKIPAQKILNEGLKPPYRFDPYYQYVKHPKCTAENVDQFMPGDW